MFGVKRKKQSKRRAQNRNDKISLSEQNKQNINKIGVALSTAADYTVGGDYTYLGSPDYQDVGDYDDGQPRPIPEAARSTTSVKSATVDGDGGGGRCAFGWQTFG